MRAMSDEGGTVPVSDEAADYKPARYIQGAERDTNLGLDVNAWPVARTPLAGWDGSGVSFSRRVADRSGKFMAGEIDETLLRFPSAPLHGWQRLHEHHVNLESGSENFHSYRILSHPDFPSCERVKRIYLLHNGLNELQSMGLYYQLASHLIHSSEDSATVCVVRPFPGHLTRFPFEAFAETPLDRYLWDGSHLFRQFLRYMIETQWFLSAIVRRSSYRSLAGANLLGENVAPDDSRLRDDVLALKMRSAWLALHRESVDLLAIAHEKEDEAVTPKDAPEGVDPFRDAIVKLRTFLKLEGYLDLDGTFRVSDEEPSLHVIGYSLGGFSAQSVFMSWPFLVASCVTLLSGGALRELSPTAFAHAEEWQTVLHSLRYELDDAMMSGRHRDGRVPGRHGAPAGGSVPGGERPPEDGADDGLRKGIEPALFPYLKRTFYEVFQQEYRGSFQSRLRAFRQRMLFIVGGNDPIVHTHSVLDSAPPGGMNMLAIGGLGHFLDAKAQDDEESEQRSFWLPEIGRVIESFTRGAAEKQTIERPYTWLDEKMKFVSVPSDSDEEDGSDEGSEPKPYEVKRLSASERLAIGKDGALPGELFERYLDDLLARQAEGSRPPGLLFALRNEIPTMLLDDTKIHEHSALLNHDDVSIARYVQGVERRREKLLEHPDRVVLVLPWNAKRIWSKIDKYPGYPSQAEAAKGEPPMEVRMSEGQREKVPAPDRDEVWARCLKSCEEHASGIGSRSVRVFDGRRRLESKSGSSLHMLIGCASEAMKSSGIAQVPSLPDCWLWVSRRFLSLGEDEQVGVDAGIGKLVEVARTRCTPADRKKPFASIESALEEDELRLITVSRARYNPRFRGRVVVEPKALRDLLLHATLCLSASVPLGQFDLDSGEERLSD
jgi:hypothetical protein